MVGRSRRSSPSSPVSSSVIDTRSDRVGGTSSGGAGQRQAGGARVFGWTRHVGRGSLDPGGVGGRGRRDGGRRRPGARRRRGVLGGGTRPRAFAAGAIEALVVDAREEYAREYISRAIKANALYEGKYPLVSALSRPVIARHLVAAAREHGADAVAHGCTGKGNDQVRFEVSIRALAPDLKVLAPVRVWGFSRQDSIEYAAAVRHPDHGHRGEAVLHRREHRRPCDRVRGDGRPVGGAARGRLRDHPIRGQRAARDARGGHPLRQGRADRARRCRAAAARDPQRPQPHRRRLRVRPAGHGREPAGRASRVGRPTSARECSR